MRFRDKLIGWLQGSKENSSCSTTEQVIHNENDDVDPFNPFPESIKIEISDVFDLHTISPRDVKRVVEEYLSESRRLGFRSVRIIHGKGIGVQRETVRTILGRTFFIKDFMDAPPEAGGRGATIAHLILEDE